MCRRCMWLTAVVLVSVAFAGLAHGQSVKVNFQTATAPVPEGYLPDSGEAYGERGNGWSYGWSRNIAGDTRERNSGNSPDKRWDTLIHLEKGDDAIWEIAIANGMYNVYIVAGDAGYTDQTNNFDVEGVIVEDPDGQTGNFDEFTLTVTVADGRLTLQPADGSSNSKICFIDITLAKSPGVAGGPDPADEATDIPRNVVTSWMPGDYAVSHDVYLGTVFEDVNAASRSNPTDLLVSQGQTAATFDPEGLLEFETTYYWRIDEVNGAPDNTIYKGDVWSFTTEPFAYAIENIIATASSSGEGTGPENTINGSGINENDEHSTDTGDMWVTAADAVAPVWIQYEFDRVYKLHELLVWNYNVQFEPVLGFGAKDVTVEYSSDGETWTALDDVEFAKAAAVASYEANTRLDMAGVPAKSVRLTINDNWGALTQIGLSEVRFLYIPAHAREPEPASGATDVSVDSVLTWRAGREAAAHDVYLGADGESLALADTVAGASFTPDNLEYGSTYYWKVDEVNEADAVPVWEGEVWSFSTQEYALIDGFEEYTDDIEAGEAIFDTWVDGWVNDTGSTVGYFDAPFAEQTTVHSGGQSMPLQYDNMDSPFYSEATRTFDSPQNWTGNGADTLAVYFQGVPGPFAELDNGDIVLGAAGTDIWNTTDEFRFAYKTLNGDGSIVALVESIANTDPWAKGGVMIRETLDAGSTFAAVYATPGNGCRYQARLTTDAEAVSDSSVATDEQIALDAPYWVKIERVGSNFNGYYSTDGENWTAMAWNPQTIAMGANVHVGLALTSHSAGNLGSAVFSGTATTGNVTGQWAVEAVGVEQPEGNAPAPLYVRLEDASGNDATVSHPAGEGAVFLAGWNEWTIPLSDVAGVNLSRVEVMGIGVGNPASPMAGGSGIIYIDDVGFGSPAGE